MVVVCLPILFHSIPSPLIPSDSIRFSSLSPTEEIGKGRCSILGGTVLTIILESSGEYGNTDCPIGNLLIDERTEDDDVGILMDVVVNDPSRPINLLQGEALPPMMLETTPVASSTGASSRGLEMAAITASNVHEGRASVVHDAPDVCEIDVDESRPDDDFGYADDAISEDIVGDAEGRLDWRVFGGDVKEFVVGYDNDCVDVLPQAVNGVDSLSHPPLPLEGEGFCDNGDGERAALLGDQGDDRRSSAPRAAAHAAGDEAEAGAGDNGG